MTDEFRKQISMYLPVTDWQILRLEAATRRLPMTELCRQWIKPHLEQIRRRRQPAWDLEPPDAE